MTSQPAISVVIPHLNEADNLARCLASLDRQRRDVPLEIIVVDNGSKVLPMAECAAVAGTRLVSEATPGPGRARNKGAGLAAAGIIAFVDADCLVQPGWAKAILERFSDGAVDVAGGDIGIAEANPGRLTDVEAFETIFAYRAQSYIERYGFVATGNMAVRAEVFRAVGPFGGISSMEDTDWGQRATKLGYRLAFIQQARVLTPSCRSFGELAVRWDRHVAHEFETVARRPRALAAWLARSLMVAISPVAEAPTVMRSRRLAGMRYRMLALSCLARIRWYRAARMVQLAFGADPALIVGRWNRD
jgi:cellulose synthase/poly-beta-1,6-N-acetylglucosamine synthase-like glycosyltransferase